MSMDITGMASMLSQTGTASATTSAATAKVDSLKGNASGLTTNSTEEELMDFYADVTREK